MGFTAPAIGDILSAAQALFNPFVGVLAVAIGVALGTKLLANVADLFR